MDKYIPVRLQNTLTGEKDVFQPITEGKVTMYNCGPTVYDYAHIGNFRTFIMSDLLRRMFAYNGYEVNQVMNITDVDDKTIRRSQDEHASLEKVTRKYEDIFFADLKSLNILIPIKTPRATENIPEMIAMIQTLLDKGIAYQSSDGIYFNISKSNNYGKLARLKIENTTQERIANDDYDKENPRDFSLWKFYTAEDGDVVYDAPFGKGRPGWHIECSAMSIKNLGETFDVHTGGQDLIFPHHTNEIAQSEGATGKTFAHYWIHGGFITVDNKKMSKSLGNIFTLETMREKNIDPVALRYLYLMTHYSSPLNFSWEALEAAETAWEKLKKSVVRDFPKDSLLEAQKTVFGKECKNKFTQYINNDLDIPKALALVWELVKDEKISGQEKRNLILDFDRVLGLKLDEPEDNIRMIPENIKKMAQELNKARLNKNFDESDKIRETIISLGFDVHNITEGVIIGKDGYWYTPIITT